MMKLVDVPDSKSGVLRDVWVRLPLSAQEMKANKKSYKINVIITLFIFTSLIAISMFVKVRHSNSPEGVFENYKWWITESVEKWTKDRDNQYYNKGKVIDWYETKDSNGIAPKDNFPDFIYTEIKSALILIFDSQDLSSKDPDQTKEIISNKLNLKKKYIVELLEANQEKSFVNFTSFLISGTFYLFLGLTLIFFIKVRFR